MEAVLIYSLKSAGILSIFYLSYQVLLKKDTCFQNNRWFLLGGIIAAFLLPLIEFTKEIVAQNPSSAVFYATTENTEELPAATESVNWPLIATIIYLTGAGILMLRLLLQLIFLLKSFRKQPKICQDNLIFVHSEEEIKPFSFFRYIVYNPRLHSSKDLEMILEHEKIHARQWHSTDVLLANLTTALLWFNPLSWMYRKSIAQNLEFIADREAVARLPSGKDYQHALVKVSVTPLQPALTNHFYQSFIKKRIVMLNKNNHKKPLFWKAGLVFPLLAIFMLCFNVKTEARVIVPQDEQTSSAGETASYEAVFTQNTTKEQLEEYREKFRKRGVDLSFSEIEYSQDGLLQSLKVNFSAEEGAKGEYVGAASGEDHIAPFKLVSYFDQNGKIKSIFFSSMSEANTTTGENIAENPEESAEQHRERTASIEKQEQSEELPSKEKNPEQEPEADPIYVINGEVVKSKSIAESIDPEKISAINVLKGSTATSLYGEEGKNGVVVITTKVSKDSSDLSGFDFNEENYSTKDREEKLEFKLNGDINASEDVKNSTKETPKTGVIQVRKINGDSQDPLYVVDGEAMDKSFEVNSIKPEDIERINVLKGESATEKYGSKAENGAIEIITKDK